MTFVIKKALVAECFSRLRNRKIHAHFAGYLCLQQRAAQLDRLDDLQPKFVDFFDHFFRVKNHPSNTPYLKPFTDQRPSNENLWLNTNVAGSYAPSSLRSTFRKVVQVTNATGQYSLRANHANLAFVHFLNSAKISAIDLAVFLYRDFDLLDSTTTITDLISIFAYEFGYSSAPNGKTSPDFATLYSLDTAAAWPKEWLESI